MSEVLASVAVTLPGQMGEEGFCSFSEHPTIAWLTSVLKKNRIEWKLVDTIAGWGNLNQCWIEFRTEIESSWGWCKLSALTFDERKIFYTLCRRGEVLMLVHYIKDGKLIPYT